MRHSLSSTRIVAGLAVIAGMCFFAPVLTAQGGPGGGPPPPGHWGGRGMGPGPGGPQGFAGGGFDKVVTGQPYSAQAVTTMQETLSNGTTISRTVTASIARDSDGRTMRSQTLKGFANGGASDGATIVTIFDPVANERIEYNSVDKTARIFALPPRRDPGNFQRRPVGGPRGNHSNSEVTVTHTSLGTQSLDNVTVEGTQTTRTVAAGAEGNDKPLVSTDQEWYSQDLQMVIQSTRNDPRFGQTTYTVSNLQRNEPNESLFQIPAGYQSKTAGPPSRRSAQ